jgi:hypothetical protein
MARAAGYWVLSGDDLLAMLQRVAAGEDPEMVYVEQYANSDIESFEDDE